MHALHKNTLILLLAKKLYLCIVILLNNGAFYMHLYLLLYSKVWCLPDVYLTHSWVNVFQVPQQDEMELCGCPGKIKEEFPLQK